VVGMGTALEGVKLSAVAWLGRHGGTASRRLKAGLVALVAILMALNAVGAYGFLARAHIASAVAGETAVAGRAADIEARIAVQAGIVTDLDRRLGQIDKAVETATARGRTTGAMQLATDQRRNRGELVAQRITEAKALADLQVEKARIEGERRTIEADLGPVRYLAMLLGQPDDSVMRWFVLVVALLLDPTAVLLLLAATRSGGPWNFLDLQLVPLGEPEAIQRLPLRAHKAGETSRHIQEVPVVLSGLGCRF